MKTKEQCFMEYLGALRDYYSEEMEKQQEKVAPATLKVLRQPMTFADKYIYYKGCYKTVVDIIDTINKIGSKAR